ncbi:MULTISPECIES: 5,10-methylenetetrahydromethanopterin reductase [Halolamina]|uniref:5,10-methylenetetrahydromethanopterin reductase n=1 Tax=Halolamina pelagica TaxID=699431 RepID=A0A1I5V5U8_9EURY|nr:MULTISPECIES: 5,10-methylenetetrahydromethanopterin reductase [Halolamina]NHX37900.1 5,10-methylenetetrahydromethanopterin reductase [Halolamina sp. R1-12]SFQ02727.1 5,10-methylenetetrahydromethanopterin reductase [Halolamina pelagica]
MQDGSPIRRGIELTPEHPVSRLVDLGETAESAGFDAVFASSHYNNRDPFQTLAAVAAQTDSIRLGPGVANPHESHPVALASRMATLDEHSGGRGVFGIGPGDPSTLRNLGVDGDDRGLRSVLEAFKVAERLWTGERVDHDGTFVAEDAGLNYEPPGGIPVYVGGEGPHMCRMAAKHADGLLFNGSHPRDLAWAGDRVAEGLEERPDHRGSFDFLAYASVSVASEREVAREAARPPVAFIAAGAPDPVLSRHDVDPERAAAVGERISEGDFTGAFERVSPGMIDAFAAAGTVDDVADRLAAVLEHADGVVCGSPLGPELDEAVELASEALELAEERV